MSIVPSFNQIVSNHNNYLANRARRGIWFDPVVAAGKVARGAYGIYKKEAERKRLSGTPHFRGFKKTRISSPQGLSAVSAMNGCAATSGSRWRKTFKSRGLSKRRRVRYRRRFIGSRNKRQYLSKWTVSTLGAVTSAGTGLAYRYSVYDSSPKDVLQTMVVVDSATAAGAEAVFDRGQKVFMSKFRKDVYIKNPFSIGINYRVIWTSTELTASASLVDIEPWCPVFHRDSWKNRDEVFHRQDVGYLSADEDITIHGKGFSRFVKMTAQDTRKLTFRCHVWIWSELQVQKGTNYSTAPTLGYIDVNVPVVYRDCYNFMIDQGLRVNDNILSGYETALTTITAPLVKTEDKMIPDT